MAATEAFADPTDDLIRGLLGVGASAERSTPNAEPPTAAPTVAAAPSQSPDPIDEMLRQWTQPRAGAKPPSMGPEQTLADVMGVHAGGAGLRATPASPINLGGNMAGAPTMPGPSQPGPMRALAPATAQPPAALDPHAPLTDTTYAGDLLRRVGRSALSVPQMVGEGLTAAVNLPVSLAGEAALSASRGQGQYAGAVAGRAAADKELQRPLEPQEQQYLGDLHRDVLAGSKDLPAWVSPRLRDPMAVMQGGPDMARGLEDDYRAHRAAMLGGLAENQQHAPGEAVATLGQLPGEIQKASHGLLVGGLAEMAQKSGLLRESEADLKRTGFLHIIDTAVDQAGMIVGQIAMAAATGGMSAGTSLAAKAAALSKASFPMYYGMAVGTLREQLKANGVPAGEAERRAVIGGAVEATVDSQLEHLTGLGIFREAGAVTEETAKRFMLGRALKQGAQAAASSGAVGVAQTLTGMADQLATTGKDISQEDFLNRLLVSGAGMGLAGGAIGAARGYLGKPSVVTGQTKKPDAGVPGAAGAEGRTVPISPDGAAGEPGVKGPQPAIPPVPGVEAGAGPGAGETGGQGVGGAPLGEPKTQQNQPPADAVAPPAGEVAAKADAASVQRAAHGGEATPPGYAEAVKEFSATSAGHRRFNAQAAELVRNGTWSPDTHMAVMEFMEPKDGGLLGKIDLRSMALKDAEGDLRAGQAFDSATGGPPTPQSKRVTLAIQHRLESEMQPGGRLHAVAGQIDAQPLAVFLEEFLHFGLEHLANHADRAGVAAEWAAKTPEQHQADFEAKGYDSEGARHAAESPQEWFVAHGVGHVLGDPSPGPATKRLISRMVEGLRNVVARLRGKGTPLKIQPLIEQLLAGIGSTPDVVKPGAGVKGQGSRAKPRPQPSEPGPMRGLDGGVVGQEGRGEGVKADLGPHGIEGGTELGVGTVPQPDAPERQDGNGPGTAPPKGVSQEHATQPTQVPPPTPERPAAIVREDQVERPLPPEPGSKEAGGLFGRKLGDPDELGFFSRLERWVGAKMKGPMASDQLRKALGNAGADGVTADELKWTGLDDWLARQDRRVSPDEVKTWLEQNRVELREVIKGKTGDSERIAEATRNVDRLTQEARRTLGPMLGTDGSAWFNFSSSVEQTGTRNLVGDFNLWLETHGLRQQERLLKAGADRIFMDLAQAHREQREARGDGPGAETRYKSLTLPGGENYREVLLTLPAKPIPAPEPHGRIEYLPSNGAYVYHAGAGMTSVHHTRAEAEAEQQRITGNVDRPNERDQANFRGSHFSEPNVVAHLRTTDRTTPEGKRVLFLEEVQSDWHEQGRDRGYRTPEAEQKAKDSSAALEAFHAEMTQKYPGVQRGRYANRNTAAEDLRYEQLLRAETDSHRAMEQNVPSAPWAKTWHEMALRRALRLAAEGGYDALGWTTGAQQNARYEGLAEQVHAIRWDDTSAKSAARRVLMHVADGSEYELLVKPDGTVHSTDRDLPVPVEGKPLAEVVGADLAKRIMAEPKGDVRGQDITIGGEGMKTFYDRDLVNYAKRLGRKWETQPAMGEIGTTFMDPPRRPNGEQEQVHVLSVTEPMRTSLTTEGQPLFGRKLPPMERTPEGQDEPRNYWELAKAKRGLATPTHDVGDVESVKARPDLANPVRSTDPEARAVMDAVDIARNLHSLPEREAQRAVREAAAKAVDADPEGNKAELLKVADSGAAMNSEQTARAMEVASRTSIDAVKTADVKGLHEAMMLDNAYRETGTVAGRAMAMRHDPMVPPDKRAQELFAANVMDPTRGAKPRIEAAKAQRDKATDAGLAAHKRLRELEARIAEAEGRAKQAGSEAAQERQKAALMKTEAAGLRDAAAVADKALKDQSAEAGARVDELRGQIEKLEQAGAIDAQKAKAAKDELSGMSEKIAQATAAERQRVLERVRGRLGPMMDKVRAEAQKALDAGKTRIGELEAEAAKEKGKATGASVQARNKQTEAVRAENKRAAAGERVKELLGKEAAKSARLRDALLAAGYDITSITPAQMASPEYMAQMVRLIGAHKATLGEKIVEYRNGMLLWALDSPLANMITNKLSAGWELGPRRLMEAAVNRAMNPLSRTGFADEAAQFGEFGPMLREVGPAMAKALRVMIRSARTELPVYEIERKQAREGAEIDKAIRVGELTASVGPGGVEPFHSQHAIGGVGGRVARAGFAALNADDQMTQSFLNDLEVVALAYRRVKAAGYTGQAAVDAAKALRDDPNSEVHLAAEAFAAHATFHDKPDVLARAAIQLREKLPLPFAFVIPFIVQTWNAMKYGAINFSPYKSLETIYRAGREPLIRVGWVKGEAYWTRGRVVQHVAENIAAWGMTMLVAGFMDPKNPVLTGAPPDNADERALWERLGIQPYSVQINGRWWSYKTIEPYATGISLTADTVGAMVRATTQGNLAAAMNQAIGGIKEQVRNKTFLRGIADLMDALGSSGSNNTGESGRKLVTGFITSFVPNIIQDAARASDPAVRDWAVRGSGEDYWNQAGQRLVQRFAPFEGNRPPIKFDLWGRPMVAQNFPGPASDFLYRLLRLPETHEVKVPVDADLLIKRWNQDPQNKPWFPDPPPPFIRKNGKTLYMTPEQYSEYSEKSGKMALQMVQGIPGLDPANPTQAMIHAIDRSISRARQLVRHEMGLGAGVEPAAAGQ